MQFIRCLCSFMRQWQLGALACGQSSTARAGILVLFCSSFPGVPLPPLPPRGAGKTGRLSGDGPCATTHSLLRLPAKHRPALRSSHVHRTGNAHSVCSTCVLRAFSAARSWQSVLGRWRLSVRFHAFPKEFHTLSGGYAFSFYDV